MNRPFLKKTVAGIELGCVINVSVAHQRINCYWDNYTHHKYRVEYFTRYQIVGRNIEFPTELITVRRKYLEDGYLMLNKVLDVQ